MAMASTCPKCGQRREREWSECPFCGVIYAKAAAPRPPLPPPVHGDAWSGRAPAAAASVGADPWDVPVPAAAGWGGGALSPDAGGGDLYRPPSAPVGEAVWPRHRSTAEPAGRGSRLAAQFVDSLFAVPLFLAVLLPGVLLDAGNEGAEMALLAGASVVALGLLAVNLHLLHSAGKTIGKKVLGIRIVRLDGTRAGLGRILVLRMVGPSLLASIPYAGTLFAFVNYLFIFRDDRRCLHDHMADTKVVVG